MVSVIVGFSLEVTSHGDAWALMHGSVNILFFLNAVEVFVRVLCRHIKLPGDVTCFCRLALM